jgi:GH25 family lysozyme M1 (1,4-beta-N-acetylmuramidase)
MLGLDLYARWQTVTNWQAVKDARLRIAPGRPPQAVEWVYVKLTDGTGQASVKGDGFVNGAKSVGLPVGGYHFAEPGDPIAQAKVFVRELSRLRATDLPPMLDLEDQGGGANIPAGEKRGWAIRFLNYVRDSGFRPALYMASYDAAQLRPDQWGVPGLVLWIASYGSNNGYRNPLTGGYSGRVDIHQYTSTGRVPGISGNVDMNESFVNLLRADDVTPDEMKNQVLNDPNWRPIQGPDGQARTLVEMDTQMGIWMAQAHAMLRALADKLDDQELDLLAAYHAGNGQVLAAVAAIPPGGVPTQEQMDALLAGLREVLPGDIAAELGRRLSESPTT